MPTCLFCLDKNITFVRYGGSCGHWYFACAECMKRYTKTKLLGGTIPRCPLHGCTRIMSMENCVHLLTPKLIAIWEQKIVEESIPWLDRVYCPKPRCSATMSKAELVRSTEKGCEGMVRCLKCGEAFCIDCYVPWHSNMSCNDYKRSSPNPPVNDMLLKDLANQKMWRQCELCKHMIELSRGCSHITCRCGYEFCYLCGDPWCSDHIYGCSDHILRFHLLLPPTTPLQPTDRRIYGYFFLAVLFVILAVCWHIWLNKTISNVFLTPN